MGINSIKGSDLNKFMTEYNNLASKDKKSPADIIKKSMRDRFEYSDIKDFTEMHPDENSSLSAPAKSEHHAGKSDGRKPASGKSKGGKPDFPKLPGDKNNQDSIFVPRERRQYILDNAKINYGDLGDKLHTGKPMGLSDEQYEKLLEDPDYGIFKIHLEGTKPEGEQPRVPWRPSIRVGSFVYERVFGPSTEMDMIDQEKVSSFKTDFLKGVFSSGDKNMRELEEFFMSWKKTIADEYSMGRMTTAEYDELYFYIDDMRQSEIIFRIQASLGQVGNTEIAAHIGAVGKNLDEEYAAGKFTKEQYDELNSMFNGYAVKLAENCKRMEASWKVFQEEYRNRSREMFRNPGYHKPYEEIKADRKKMLDDYLKKNPVNIDLILKMIDEVRSGTLEEQSGQVSGAEKKSDGISTDIDSPYQQFRTDILKNQILGNGDWNAFDLKNRLNEAYAKGQFTQEEYDELNAEIERSAAFAVDVKGSTMMGRLSNEKFAELFGGLGKSLDEAYAEGRLTKEEYDELNAALNEYAEKITVRNEWGKAFADLAAGWGSSPEKSYEHYLEVSKMTPGQYQKWLYEKVTALVENKYKTDRSLLNEMVNAVRYSK